MRAAAGTPNAAEVTSIWVRFGMRDRISTFPVEFTTAPGPLPYEQTTRTPIPEAIRAEVWRRDQGCCVNCGSKENLQFDHIIPIAKGGATSPQNLQLLCKGCNLAKGIKI
ncbi:MAG: HNH endonuclease [Deltaproteobacteria bacterium]|nr:HNH endonuclease [Deltaproteobacteria bacterium]